MLRFARDVIVWLPTLNIHHSVCDQLIRSATSIGANYSEALNASSKTDFRHKIYIAKKEAAETKYWLRLIHSLPGTPPNKQLLLECQYFLMVLQKTVNSIKAIRSNKAP